VLKGGLRVYVNQALLPVLVALRSQHALDAVPEAYHNLAAVWWGAFAASVVIRDQVVIANPAVPGRPERAPVVTCPGVTPSCWETAPSAERYLERCRSS
jgi:hypothetical protein